MSDIMAALGRIVRPLARSPFTWLRIGETRYRALRKSRMVLTLGGHSTTTGSTARPGAGRGARPFATFALPDGVRVSRISAPDIRVVPGETGKPRSSKPCRHRPGRWSMLNSWFAFRQCFTRRPPGPAVPHTGLDLVTPARTRKKMPIVSICMPKPAYARSYRGPLRMHTKTPSRTSHAGRRQIRAGCLTAESGPQIKS